MAIYKKRAVKHGFSVLLDHGLLSVAMFITGVLVARSTDQEIYGLYVLVMSLILNIYGSHRALVSLPFTILIPHADPEHKNKYFGSTIIYTLFFLLTILITTAILSFFIDINGYETKAANITIPFICAVSAFVFREHLRSAVLAHLKIRKAVLPNIIASLIHICLIIYFYIIGTLSLNNALFIIAVSALISTLFMLYLERNSIELDFTNIKCALPEFWATGKWNLSNVVWYIGASQIYPWLIIYIIDKQSVAIYGACFAISAIFTPILRGANSYILPRMTHSLKSNNSAGLIRMVKLSVIAMSIPFTVWVITGITLGDQLLSVIYTENYSGHGTLISLLVVRIFVEALTTPATSALQALKHSKTISKSLIAGTIATIFPGLILICSFGLTGAGMSILLSTIITSLYKWVALAKIMDNRIHCAS